MKPLTHRFLAQITLEANAAFAINSGKLGLLNDNVVAKDANRLPYLPGTSLAGVLRHSIEESLENELFGSKGKAGSEADSGSGSRLILSPGLMVGKEGKVIEGLQVIDFNDSFYSLFGKLPLRDHVKINKKGAAEKGAKYDEELVFKGTRFVFELELKGTDKDKSSWVSLLSLIESPDFRLGSGTRKGHGEFRVIHDNSTQRIFDLRQEEDLKDYLSKSASLNSIIPKGTPIQPSSNKELIGWEKFQIEMKARDFFLFGAGFGDGDVDNISKREKVISWSNGVPSISESDYILIPATSIKGALAHRVRFHYSKLIEDFIESPKNGYNPDTSLDIEKILKEFESQIDFNGLSTETDEEGFKDLEKKIGNFNPLNTPEWLSYSDQLQDEAANLIKAGSELDESNIAVETLFGYTKNRKGDEGKETGQKGNVLIHDVYIPYKKGNEKVFNHVKIDRFTGGATDGALFQEKAYFGKNDQIDLTIYVLTEALNDQLISKAWSNVIDDLLKGLIPLGGMNTKGHGFFTGTLTKN
jgi:CRISPR/Cas system CSM-associated protein Csm3 (group 7 of RAMP superfamily)